MDGISDGCCLDSQKRRTVFWQIFIVTRMVLPDCFLERPDPSTTSERFQVDDTKNFKFDKK